MTINRRLIALLLAGTPVLAQKPALRPEPIHAVLRAAVERKDVAGVVAMVATPDAIIYRGVFGKRDVASNVPMTEDTIFRIYSMTKPITSVAAMQLVEQGKIKLEDPVERWLPDISKAKVLRQSNGEWTLHATNRPITLHHLLTHTSGFAHPVWDKTLREYLMRHKDTPAEAVLMFHPGEKWEYGVSSNVVGPLIEKISGVKLDEYFRSRILEPLQMQDTFFNVPPEKVGRLASSHQRQSDGSLRENERRPPQPVSSFNASSGLYGTAADYVRLMQMMLHGGNQGKVRLLKESTVRQMTRNQTGNIEAGLLTSAMPEGSNDVDFHPGFSDRFGYGFLINPVAYDKGRASGSLAWAGAANTFFWIDPQSQLCAVLMMQILPFFDHKAVALLRDFERAVYSAR